MLKRRFPINGSLALAVLATLVAPATANERRQEVVQAERFDTSRPLREIIAEQPPLAPLIGAPREIPNIFPKAQTRANMQPELGPVRSLNVQTAPTGNSAPPITFSFNGLSIGNGGGGVPPDTNGDVSPAHYIQWINTSWTIIDKVTGVRSAPVAGNSFWSGFGGPCQTRNDGDPIALWDDRAQRWVMSQFVATTPGAQCFAISTTSDPLGTYHRYQFNFALFGDYPHIGVWTDGGGQSAYLLKTHEFNGANPPAYQGSALIAVERDKMLNGQAAAMVRFGGIDQFGIQPAHLEGQVVAPTGACPMFVHFDFDTSEYLFWDMCLNWTTPASSTLSTQPTRIAPAEPFVPRFADVPQLGSTAPLDAFGTHIMYRAAARAFPAGALAPVTMVVNQTVLGPTEQGAIKWTQFNFSAGQPRFPNGSLFLDGFESGGAALPTALGKSLFDEGTFAPDANSRWLGGIAIDRSGNIGVGYSVSSTTINPALRTTGRTLGDTPGTLRDEQVCTPTSTGSQLSTSGRWGDYSSMSVDPADECTFWFTSEYYPATAGTSWSTRVCAFRFPECGVPTMALVIDSPRRVELCGTPTPAAPTFALRLGVYDGFNTPTAFTINGFPGGVNAVFAPQTVTPPASSTLTLNGAQSLASGEYSGTVTATATAGSLVRTLPIQVGVSSALAAAPSLTAPANGAVQVKVRPTLTWQPIAGAVSYRVEVSLTNTFAALVASDTVTTTSWAVNVGLAPSTPYFWRVRSVNYCGNGTFSAARTFTTGIPGTCPAGTTLTNVFTDAFEGGANGWTTDGTGGTAWTQAAALAGTGMTTTVWRVPNNTVTSDRGLISPSFAIPPGAAAAFVSFDAHYSFETDTPPGCWDGGAIEAKRTADSAFLYRGPSVVFTNGYNGVVLAGAPLAGRDVWCRVPTPSPARSIVDLDEFIGQAAQLRFRATTDSNTAATAPNGMSIDNLRVDVCQ